MRVTARISASVMSAVSSVTTPGVLLTKTPRWRADITSIWSMPAPKFAISFSRSPARASMAAVIWSVTVGTRTSASCISDTS